MQQTLSSTAKQLFLYCVAPLAQSKLGDYLPDLVLIFVSKTEFFT